MTGMDDFEQKLAAWLRGEAPDQAPDWVLEQGLQRAAQQPQGRGWLDRFDGGARLGRVVRISAMAAVIVGAAVVGLRFANLAPGGGGLASSLPSASSPGLPTPSPTALPTPSPTALPTPSPTALPTPSDRTPSPECIHPPVDVLTLAYQSDPVACYGNTPLTVDGYLTSPGVIDGPCAFVEPAWLSCNSWVELDVVRTTAATTSIILAYVSTGNTSYPFFAAIQPTAGPRDQFMDRNVRVTGHFDDPAARTCRFVAGSGFSDAPNPATDLISSCRRIFVVTTIVPL
jgi:hypothetical protein